MSFAGAWAQPDPHSCKSLHDEVSLLQVGQSVVARSPLPSASGSVMQNQAPSAQKSESKRVALEQSQIQVVHASKTIQNGTGPAFDKLARLALESASAKAGASQSTALGSKAESKYDPVTGLARVVRDEALPKPTGPTAYPQENVTWQNMYGDVDLMNRTLMDEKDLPPGSQHVNGETETADWLQEYKPEHVGPEEQEPPARSHSKRARLAVFVFAMSALGLLA